MSNQINDILTYWFPNSLFQKWWFNKDNKKDNEITNKFNVLFNDVIQDKYQHWLETPKGCTALIIILDQFSRHINRTMGNIDITHATYKANQITKYFIDHKYDYMVPIIYLPFVLMPLRHTLNIEDMSLLLKQINIYENHWLEIKIDLNLLEKNIWTRFKLATLRHKITQKSLK